MDQARKTFLKRQSSVRKKHRRLADGYTTHVTKAGVIEHRPQNPVKRASVLPLAILVAFFLGFKVLLLTQLGEAAYQARVTALKDGSPVEWIGALLMQIDPATQQLAGLLETYL